MNLDHHGKRVLVTGGSKGIGFACAAAFTAEGVRVAICSRTRANLDQALAKLPGAVGFAADCSDAEAADAMVAQVEAEFGTIDILVNSAGAARRSRPTRSPRPCGAPPWRPSSSRRSMWPTPW